MTDNCTRFVTIMPFGRRLRAGHGANLARFLHENGIHLRSDCGGKGLCGKCAVFVGAGADSWKPACQVELLSDLVVEVQLSSLIGPSEPIEKPIDTGMYPAESSSRTSRQGFGIALDLGTTTIAGYLCDFAEGIVAGSAAALNPQSVYGADVISRIGAASSHPRHLQMLQQLTVSAFDEMARSLAEGTGIGPDLINEIVVVGNPTMLHIFQRPSRAISCSLKKTSAHFNWPKEPSVPGSTCFANLPGAAVRVKSSLPGRLELIFGWMICWRSDCCPIFPLRRSGLRERPQGPGQLWPHSIPAAGKRWSPSPDGSRWWNWPLNPISSRSF